MLSILGVPEVKRVDRAAYSFSSFIMAFPRLLLTFVVFFVLLVVASSQPPDPDGADSIFLEPLSVPPSTIEPSAEPGGDGDDDSGGEGAAGGGEVDDGDGGGVPSPSATPTRSMSVGAPPPDSSSLPITSSSSSPAKSLPSRSSAPSVVPPPVTPPPVAPPAMFCRRIRFRLLNGQCTSAVESTWAEARRVQFSYLASHSSTVPTGFGLKSAREISNILSDQKEDILNSHGLNELFVFFGQFVDHNLVATPADGESWPIIVPSGDPFFSAGSEMAFKRSSRGFTGQRLVSV